MLIYIWSGTSIESHINHTYCVRATKSFLFWSDIDSVEDTRVKRYEMIDTPLGIYNKFANCKGEYDI